MSEYNGLVLVVGATGGVGRRVVELMQKQGLVMRLLLRDQAKAAKFKQAGIETVLADLTAPKLSLTKAMDGVTAVISALGTRQPFSSTNGLREVDLRGTQRLVDAAKQAKVEHFILNSTMGVYQKRNLFKPLSLLFYPKWEAENYLVQSGLTYTIIRPGGLVDDDADLKGPSGWTHKPAYALSVLSGEGGFQSLGRVHRDDVADGLVKGLWTPAARNRILDVLDRSSVKPTGRHLILKDFFQ